MKARTPPVLRRWDGRKRQVGFELELCGPSLEEIADLIVRLYGGRWEQQNRFVGSVDDTQLGDFRLEVDAAILQKMAGDSASSWLGNSGRQLLEDALDALIAAVKVVPTEIVMPPVTVDAVDRLEPLRKSLLELGAEGTSASLLFGFGLHINPEVPELTAECVLNHLRAFLLRYDWLVERVQVDLTRQLMPFINPFPDEYARLTLDESYEPDLDCLIDDYLEANPTRNRPLDLLPLFAFLKPGKVERLDDQLTSPRPTFHYRLPNSQIHDPAWSLAQEWNRWLEVEKLAAQPPLVEREGP